MRRGMNRTGWAALAPSLLAVAGCATSPDGAPSKEASRVVAAPEAAVRDVVRNLLGGSPGYEEVDPDHWRTGWIEGESPRHEMGFVMRRPFHERRRYAVSIARVSEGGVCVRVLCRFEEKGLAGARARTWDPIASDGSWEKAFLDALENRVAPKPAGESGSAGVPLTPRPEPTPAPR